ncbi:MAG TPA: LptF/LptG family permease [Bacteroidota bacterium]|nr:LptF/LptG family permease [Bacteroidota bacterium]
MKAHIAPFLGSFFVLMALFVLQFVMKFMDQLIGKGLSGAVIIELMIMNLAWMVVLAVPMAVLIATLMAFGGLSASSEVTAMKASGISLYKMVAPVLVCAAALSYFMVVFNNKILPEANHRSKTLMMDIRKKKPTLTLVPGLFSQDMPGLSILVRKTFETSNELEGVIIYNHKNPQKNTMITAKRGIISFTADYKRLIMDLYDGEVHEIDNATFHQYRAVTFAHQRLTTAAEGFDFERSSNNAFSRGDREMTVGEMRYMTDSLSREVARSRRHVDVFNNSLISMLLNGSVDKQTPDYALWSPVEQYTTIGSRLMYLRTLLDAEYANINYREKQKREFQTEIQKKYSIPLACFIFVLVGAPLGVMARRGGFGIAASLSLGFFLLYWASLIGGEKLADREIITPWFGMWMANLALAPLGMVLTYRIAKENVELSFDWLLRLVPRRLFEAMKTKRS